MIHKKKQDEAKQSHQLLHEETFYQSNRDAMINNVIMAKKVPDSYLNDYQWVAEEFDLLNAQERLI